ncbi:MAG: helix-turn-helix domain-containing protein [Candidatus Dadabacteria bacterium]
MTGLLPSSYQDLIIQAGNYSHLPKPDAQSLLEDFGIHNLKFHAEAPIFFIIDYTEGKYLYVDPSCKSLLGFDDAVLMKEGPMYWTSQWHPKDCEIFNKNIVKEIAAFLKNVSPQESTNYSFSYNYRVKGKGDIYVSVLQRATYYISPDHIPMACVGFAIDISHFKEDNKVIFTIEKVDRNFSSLSKLPIYKAVYFPETLQDGLSKREAEILQLINEGLKSKEIAKKLFISKNTVDNHRKKLLEKLNAKNSSELIYLAKKKGIL